MQQDDCSVIALFRRASASFVLVFLLLCSAGCGEREILTDIDRQQSFDVILALANSGISANEETSGRGGRYRVLVPSGDYLKSISVLEQHGLPREESKTLESLTEGGRFVPMTPEMSATRLDLALGAQVERLVRALPGIIDVRALVRSNLNLRDLPPQASLVVRVSADSKVNAAGIEDVAKRAVPGLDPERISITISPVSLEPAISKGELVPLLPPLSFRVPLTDRKNALQQIYSLLLLIVVCTFIVGMYIGGRGRRPAPPARPNRPTESFLIERGAFQSGETQGVPAQKSLTKGGPG